TCPARVAALAKITPLPTWQSCATCVPVISRLLEPMRVTPPPPTVPRLTVTPSRKVLSSPIRNWVLSPPYLRSWGAVPSDAKGKIRQRAPPLKGPPPVPGASRRGRPSTRTARPPPPGRRRRKPPPQARRARAHLQHRHLEAHL